MISLLVMTDGRRDCIAATIPSALANLSGPITHRIIHDDSGDPEYRGWLADTFPTFEIIGGDRAGFGGAIRRAWARLVTRAMVPRAERFVFHVEDDFTFNRPVDLTELAEVLDHQADLVQLALRRQPWNPQERAAGGVVEQHPDDYLERTDGAHRWLEHRRFFTTNPSLYRHELCHHTWPAGANSEGHFTHQLLVARPQYRFGFWGARDSGEWVTHIGNERVGAGY